MDLNTSEILNLSDSDYYKLLKSIPNFEYLFKIHFANDLGDRINRRMNTLGPMLNLSNIQGVFPTLQEIDGTIKNPFYIKCFKSPNDYVVGYTGFKEDAMDKGFSSFPKLGINLWILVYDHINDKKAFMFIPVENFYEIGTKHGMLLHLVSQTFPSLKIISAGEILVEEDLSEAVYRLTWNASSGTITKALFDRQTIQLSFLGFLYPEINFTAMKLQYRPQQTIIDSISGIEFGQPLKRMPLNVFIPIYENVILGLLQNFLSKILMDKVIPYAFPQAPTSSVFQYLETDVNKPIPFIMPTFVRKDPSITIDSVALANCANPYIREHLYVFANESACNEKIKNTPVVAPRYCDLLPKVNQAAASRRNMMM